jgi:hypothetical protein
VANLLESPSDWRERFDLVVEINTLQALPAELRPAGLDAVAGFVAPAGRLLVICRARDEDEDLGGPPWPLARTELQRFCAQGLRELSVNTVVDTDEEATRRFVAWFDRPDTHRKTSVPE